MLQFISADIMLRYSSSRIDMWHLSFSRDWLRWVPC